MRAPAGAVALILSSRVFAAVGYPRLDGPFKVPTTIRAMKSSVT